MFSFSTIATLAKDYKQTIIQLPFNLKHMKHIQTLIDFNNQECSVSFGIPFKFKGPLFNLPKVKNGKPVHILGLTPYTVELVIPIPFSKRSQIDNITYLYSFDTELMIERLQSLSINLLNTAI